MEKEKNIEKGSQKEEDQEKAYYNYKEHKVGLEHGKGKIVTSALFENLAS